MNTMPTRILKYGVLLILLALESTSILRKKRYLYDNTTTVDNSASRQVYEVFWPAMNPNTMWEYDFMREIFPYPYFTHYENPTQPKTNQDRDDLPRVGAIVCTGGQHLNDVKVLAESLKRAYHTDQPKLILIHLSDEFLGASFQHSQCRDVYDKASFVLRQYAYHGSRNQWTTYPHLIQIPLGYMTGMLGKFPVHDGSDNDEQKHFIDSVAMAKSSMNHKASQRRFMWSFIGGKHGKGKDDRIHALEVWSSWKPNHVNESIHTVEMKHIYDDSKFVIVGRGWNSIDCFRTYEALISGAIPVVVASNAEIDRVLAFEGTPGKKPPLIFSQSWEEALAICKKMTDEEIDKRRSELVHWYDIQLEFIRGKVFDLFEITSSSKFLEAPHRPSNQPTASPHS